MDGELAKLKIIACEDAAYRNETGEEYIALFNPNELTQGVQIEYDGSQSPGTTGTDLKFKRILPEDLKLNLMFDGTGISIDSSFNGSEPVSVNDQLNQFKKVVLEYKGDKHTPRYLKIIWGTFLFKGRLTNLKVTYTLFNSDGTPLRAKAEITMKCSVEDNLRVAKEDASSPDLTHLRIVKEGDTLPLMTYRIYGNPSYYIEVAKFNKLKHFRNLEVGSTLAFPPLDKTTR